MTIVDISNRLGIQIYMAMCPQIGALHFDCECVRRDKHIWVMRAELQVIGSYYQHDIYIYIYININTYIYI